MERNTVQILGYGIDTINLEDAVNKAYETPGQIVTINPEMISSGLKSPEFAKVINSANLVVPDGIGVVLGLKILGYNAQRLPGIELGKALLTRACKENKKVALVGAKEQVLNLTVKNLKNEMPDLNIVYAQNGYFEDETEILDALAKASPDLILVALGSPKQEFFIKKLSERLNHSIMIGLGGSFDVWAGVVKRAPIIYQKLGLEWLYRTVCEPQRFHRLFPALPIFLYEVIKERLRKK